MLRRALDTTDHEQIAYDLADWTDDRRVALDLMLNGAEISREWEDAVLVIARARGTTHPVVHRQVASFSYRPAP